MSVVMEDIPYNLHTMADIVGIESFLQICKMYGGSSIYIPVYNKMIMGNRNRRIIGEYNGKNIDRLRVRYEDMFPHTTHVETVVSLRRK